MARAGGYVLYLQPERQRVFESTFEEGETFSEPVADFVHTRTAPLICFVVLDGQHITHIASGRRGLRAGTGLRRLNVLEAQRLQAPIPILAVVRQLDSRTLGRATSVFQSGGLFTPKAFESAIDAISAASEEARALLQRFSRLRRELVAGLSPKTRAALGEQKEAVLSALAFAGLDRRAIHEWSPPSEGQPTSFLDGLPNAVMREDAMIVNDLVTVPGLEFVRTLPYTGAVFEGQGKRLTVVLANRLPLEQLTGTDLIYFNETHRSFVMVQYKAMNQEDGIATFRLPNAGLAREIERMQAINAQLLPIQAAATRENFRLSPEAFYIKLCARSQFNPDDIKLFPGMYFSLSQWLCHSDDPHLVGPRGGRMVTYENTGRYIDNDLFINLVADAWIGTHAEQSDLLATAIRETLQSGRAVALAIETPASESDASNE
jgi:hypothetical protein